MDIKLLNPEALYDVTAQKLAYQLGVEDRKEDVKSISNFLKTLKIRTEMSADVDDLFEIFYAKFSRSRGFGRTFTRSEEGLTYVR